MPVYDNSTRSSAGIKIMEANGGNDNECSSTSPEENAVNMTTTARSPPPQMEGKGGVDVSSTSEVVVDNDEPSGDDGLCIDMSMTAPSSNGLENEMNDNNDGIASPEELTIDENSAEVGGGVVEEEETRRSDSPPQSPPSQNEAGGGDDVCQSSGQVIASPPSSPPPEEVGSSLVVKDDSEDCELMIAEGGDVVTGVVDENKEMDGVEESVDTVEAVVDGGDEDSVLEGVKECQDISSPVPEERSPGVTVTPVIPIEDSSSNSNTDTPASPPQTEEDLRIEEMSSAHSPDVEMASSEPVDPQRVGEDSLDEISIERTVIQVDLSSPGDGKGQESSPDSPEDVLMDTEEKQEDSISYEDCSSREPKSPDGLNGTPVSSVVGEESQSQTSLPPPEELPPPPLEKEKKKESKKVAKAVVAPADEDIDEEDLEDGEIMDEEEEKEDEDSVKAASPPPVVVKPKSSSKDKNREKESKAKESSKRKRQEEPTPTGSDLDPVKKLLAEVKERDKSEKEKEREKRRREKKRSRDDKKEEERQKKKKRKMSDEDEEGPGEEFLLVRGASPSDENWEEFGGGDDRRGNKGQRRRDSEGSGSPQNRQHHRRPEVEASPIRRPGSDRGKRREPKSDVICAYFMQGKCQKSGEDCNFSHDAVPPRKMELCKFWMMECCAKKEKCLYLHNDFPCKYYHTGLVCRQGDRCKFSHQPLHEGTKGVLLKHIETAPKEILGDFPRLNRQGALNLINKMEAKIKGIPYIEESEDNNHGPMNHGPPHGHGHGGPPPHHHQQHSHGPPDRGHGGHGHDRSRGDRGGHYGGPPPHENHRGRGERDRGPPPPIPDNRVDRRQSRWEQSQPTKDDQHKLQELMNEAGISGYYKDTMENNSGSQGMPTSQGQQNVFPPQMQNLQPPLLPMLPQFLPGMLPQAANNPALASVLASLNIPGSGLPPNALSQFNSPLIDTPPGSQGQGLSSSQSSQQGSQQNLEEPKGDTPENSSIPDNLPKMQRELFLRIQQQQLKNENKAQTQEKEPEEPEENWYSDDEEEDTKKKEELKAEINDQISSVLSQIRQQSQQQQPAAATSKDSNEGTKNFFGDTDLRSAAPAAATDFKDVDLRTNMFKKINILPATEINASLSSHGPMVYKVMVVAGLRDRPDYSQVRQTLNASAILMDPRLGPKRSNSIPTPASPTDQAGDTVGGLSQPLSIPEGAPPVFDPRMRGPQQNAPSQNQMMADNSLMGQMNMNDFNNPFNRDPRGGPGPQGPGGQQGVANNANQQAAQNLALAAAAAAMMQQQWPNGQPPFDPNLFMLAGLPFLPQGPPPVTTSQGQNPNMQNMEFGNSLLGNPGMRFRPPFMNQPPNQQQHPNQQQQQPSSSWERFRQGQGQGDLSPPL